MTMTAEQLAELDAVMAKAEKHGWGVDGDGDLVVRVPTCWVEGAWQDDNGRNNAAAIVALHNAYPDLRAMIDAQAATIADLLALALQYRNDLRYPPTADSITRRLAAIDAVLAKVTGDA